ncbi:SLAIN motif-containing protein-like isoform X2 [Hippoglossus stenolepis]|uniref:SLAIN motif-containing protein-like isoform X2 n=1 Tax=Hippoglossus stenolepis TaxID=195615 RepID=UPI00159C0A72|nr:SLAIN motif-containing protein-like isoform X2 [Hippoglossus stenolepis]
MKSNSEQPEDSSHSYCSIWMDTEPATFKSCNGHSFAMDARVRLDHLKSGCNPPPPCGVTDGTLNNYNSQKNASDDEPKEEESALDSVELLDVEDGEQDEESWLYESPKKQATEEKSESALTWCRHVLDNPSPEVEAACRQLMNRLDGRPSSHLYRRPAVCHRTVGKSSGNTTQNISHSPDNNKLSISNNSIHTNYRLEDITDVRIMAQIQEASLRQDYVSAPRRSPESPFYFNTAVENSDDFTPGNKTEASSPSRWSPRLLSQSSPSSQSPTSAARQSPKLARLQQQVTQFKLLKLTQNQASAGRTGSPVRTSLRSLQAVRNSRSFETDDYLPAHQTAPTASGASSARMGPSSWSPSLSPASVSSSSARDHLVRIAAMKRPQRSQSLSPCRIAQSAKVYLSRHGRVFASPERSTPLAWVRYAPHAQQ